MTAVGFDIQFELFAAEIGFYLGPEVSRLSAHRVPWDLEPANCSAAESQLGGELF